MGKRIAELLSCPAALVTAGCASALSLATAACVAGDDRERIRRLPDTTGMKNEVIVQKTHRVGYDHAIRNAGVRMIEVETREELENAINERTAMMFFLNSADPEGKVHHEEFVAIGKKHNVPTLIDAAADVPPVENLWRFTKMGFDLVGFSGGKGLRGPQSSGLLLGRKDLIEAAKLNTSPNGDTLCRTNKVNKEEIIGMLVALEIYLKEDHAAIWKDWEGRCRTHLEGLEAFEDVKTEVFVPADRQRRAAPARELGFQGARPHRVADGQEAARGRAQHRGDARLEAAVGDRRLDDGARRRRDRRRADPRDPRRHVTRRSTADRSRPVTGASRSPCAGSAACRAATRAT